MTRLLCAASVPLPRPHPERWPLEVARSGITMNVDVRARRSREETTVPQVSTPPAAARTILSFSQARRCSYSAGLGSPARKSSASSLILG